MEVSVGLPLYYIHGKDSGPNGVRSLFLKQKLPHIEIPALPNDIPERLALLDDLIQSPCVMVATSLGGLTALLWLKENGAKVKALVLVAPAVGTFDPAYQTPEILEVFNGLVIPHEIPTWLLAATQDEVIPFVSIEACVSRSQPHPELHYFRFDEGHLLHSEAALNCLEASVHAAIRRANQV